MQQISFQRYNVITVTDIKMWRIIIIKFTDAAFIKPDSLSHIIFFYKVSYFLQSKLQWLAKKG